MPSETLVAMFRAQVERGANRVALRSKRSGRWIGTTWAEWDRRSSEIAAALVEAGVAPGDRVALFANTREEWAIVDVAILLAGAVTVPVYPTLPADQAAFILEDSGAKVAFVGDGDQLAKLFEAGAGRALGSLAKIVVFDPPRTRQAESPQVVSLARFNASPGPALEARSTAVKPDDLASIVYTSGTSGPPKGVMLTHGNFAFEVSAVGETLGLSSSDEQLLFLPLAHIFAKILLVAQLEVGFTTAFAESMIGAMDDMSEVEPTFFGSVPRLYEKIHSVVTERAAQGGAVREKAYRWALSVGRRVARLEQKGETPGRALALEHRYADKLVLSRIRARFGRRLRFAISGAAPLSKELAEWFHACGVLVLEGYGLTETTAATNVNRPRRFAFGTVGPAIAGVEVRLAPDGEVMMKGPNVMKGYWNRPDETAEVLDPDGWLRSGDVGEMDRAGMLTITDRKKDIIVTAGGKNIAPQNIEAALRESPWISQAIVHGDKRKHLVAIVTLDPETIGRWARDRGRDDTPAALAKDPEVRALVEAEIDAVNRTLARYETIKRFAILERDLSIEKGELTPTLKVKRKIVSERFRDVIDRMYEPEV